MDIPFPPLPFGALPPIYEAERGFEFLDQDGKNVEGYLRRASADHEFAYSPLGKLSHGKSRDGRRLILTGAKYVREGDGRYRFNNEYVVIKKLSKLWIRTNPDHPESWRTEIAAATLLGDDEHVHTRIEVLEDRRYVYIVMPYLGLDMFDTLSHHRPQDMVQFTRAMVNDLIYIKEKGVIHRDISPENIIVVFASQGSTCLLIDFAMALRCAQYEGHMFRIVPQEPCGKRRYMSPEVWNSNPLDFGVDVWALGCIFFFIFTGQWTYNESMNRHEFRGKFLYDQPGDRCWQFYIEGNGIAEAHERNFDGFMIDPNVPIDFIRAVELLPLVQSLTDVQRDLLSRMLQIDPANRIMAEHILQHPYFQ